MLGKIIDKQPFVWLTVHIERERELKKEVENGGSDEDCV